MTTPVIIFHMYYFQKVKPVIKKPATAQDIPDWLLAMG
jgi:hypothetical protein